MPGSLHRYAVAHPLRALGIAAIVTAIVAPGLGRLELRTDGRALAPAGAPGVVHDAAVRAEFRLADPAVLLLQPRRGDVYETAFLATVQRVTEAVAELDVEPWQVTSLATEKGDRVFSGTLDFRRYLDPLPETAGELAALRATVESIAIHLGTIVAADAGAAAVFVGVPAGADRAAFYARLRDLAAEEVRGVADFDVIGAPVAEALLGTHILQDLGVPQRWLEARLPDPVPRGFPADLRELRQLAGRVGLVPLAIALMAAVFLVAFRRLAAAALPLVEVAACLIVVFGAMGWCGVPIYLTTTILPVILVSIGVADEVHILSRVTRRFAAHPDEPPSEAVAEAVDEVAGPVVRTSVTTAAAFLAFALSPIEAVQAFGVFAAVGIVACMLWSLGVTPALLVLVPRAWLAPRAVPHRVSRLSRIAVGSYRRRRLVLGVTLAIAATAALGAGHVHVQDGWISGFAEDSAFRLATERFDRQFLGTHLLWVRIDAAPERWEGDLPGEAVDHHRVLLSNGPVDPGRLVGAAIRLRGAGGDWSSHVEAARQGSAGLELRPAPGDGSPRAALGAEPGTVRYEITRRPLLIPEALRRLGGLEDAIESLPGLAVGGVRGPHDFVSTTGFIAFSRAENSRAIPDRPARLRWLWERLAIIRGPERIRQLVRDDRSAALLTVYLGEANYADTARLMRSLRDHEREHLAPHGFSLSFAGDVAVSQALIEAVVTTQVRSLLVSLVVILALAAWLHRSAGFGLVTVVPCALAVLFNFMVMGVGGIPLGVATSMFAGMILGVGVDYAIHFVARYRHARERGQGAEAAIADAAAVTGPAIAIDAAAVALGFGVLALSQVPSTARLGALAAVCIASCLLATFVVLPALLGALAGRGGTSGGSEAGEGVRP